jgi:protein-tyrosine phosphatase
MVVHCVAGISRSATVVLDFLMTRDGLDFDTALARVKKARRQVQPNPLFERLLKERAVQRHADV